MANQENIHLFLVDGSLRGFTQCRIDNWNFTAYKVPRTEIGVCSKWPDLKKNSIYFLFGKSDDEKDVYVGQASERINGESVVQRIKEYEHDCYKDFWTEAVIFAINDSAWGLTELSYLEFKFHDIIKSVKRYTLLNRNTPSSGNPDRATKSMLEIFIERSKLIMGLLGYEVLEELPDEGKDQPVLTLPKQANVIEPLVYIGGQNARKASGKRTGDGKFIVFAGSRLKDGLLLKEDFPFNSPTAAAKAILGYQQVSGPALWKTADGIALKDILDDEVN